MRLIHIAWIAAFSTYITSESERLSDDLLRVEVWDYLRGILILACTGMYDDDFSTIRTENAGRSESDRRANICAGLVYILENTHAELGKLCLCRENLAGSFSLFNKLLTASYLVYSPLTQTMMESLKSAVYGEHIVVDCGDSFAREAKLLIAKVSGPWRLFKLRLTGGLDPRARQVLGNRTLSHPSCMVIMCSVPLNSVYAITELYKMYNDS